MLRDLRIAVRSLRSWRWGAAVAVITLALGIGTTTTVYALLRALMDDGTRRIDDVARVGRIYASSRAMNIERKPLTFAEFDTVLSRARSFEHVAAWTRSEMTVGRSDEEATVSVTRVSRTFFSVLRARPAVGRWFADADVDAAAPVALVSEAVWRQRFAGRSIAEAPPLILNGAEHRVIGAVPASLELGFIGIGGDVWLPLTATDVGAGTSVSLIARLKPEQTWTAAAGELLSLTPAASRAVGWDWRAIPVQEDSRYRTVASTAMTLVPALIVLIIGCVNVACMLLARGLERETELSVRAALGASRGTIFRQLLGESLVLASIAGIAGAAISTGLVRLVASSQFIASKPQLAARLSGDLALLPIGIGATSLACLLFGTVPAFRLSRRDVAASLKGVGAPSRVRIAGYGARDLVVFVELGLAVMLIVVTAMWFSFFSTMQRVTISFAANEVITVPVASQDLEAVRERVSALPGVTSVAATSLPPGAEASSRGARVTAQNGRAATIGIVGITAPFFAATGLPIVRGRGFDRSEASANSPVAVISESAARSLWPDGEALGKQLDVSDENGATRVTVIGVSRDALEYAGLGRHAGGYVQSTWATRRTIYRPLDTALHREPLLLVRAPDAHDVIRLVAAAARTSAATPSPRAVVIGDQIGRVPGEAIGLIRLFGGFAVIALLLAGTGIFGVISQSVVQRTNEFGVRMALGATRGRVLRMVLTREGKLIAAALAVGSVGTVAATRALFAELVWISAMNPGWPVALIGLAGFVAAVGCGLATYRIVKFDPWTVLRRS